MSRDVFISHSKRDKAIADSICEALEKSAISCWIAPRDVRLAQSFPGEIRRAIQQSKVMLLILTERSNASENVFREVQLATKSTIPILPLRIEDVPLNDNLEYYLSAPQWLDAFGETQSNYMPRLEQAIRELIGQSPVSDAAAAPAPVASSLKVTDPLPPVRSPKSGPIRWVPFLVLAALLFIAGATAHFALQECLETPLSKFIPDSLSTAIVLIFVAIAIAPYLAGQDIGPLKVPKISDKYVRELRIAGPIIVIVVLVVLFAPLNFVLQQECNPLRNGSAEDGDAGWTAAWWDGAAPGRMEVATDDAYNGKESFKLSTDHPQHLRWVQAVRLQRYTKYRLTAYVRTENVVAAPGQSIPYRGANIAAQQMNPKQGPTHSDGVLGTTGWHPISVIFSTQDAVDYEIQLQLGSYGSITTGTAWFDDVRLRIAWF